MPAKPTKPPKLMTIISRLNIGGISPYVIPVTGMLRDRGYETALVSGSVGKAEGDMGYLAGRAGFTPISVPSLGREISPLKDLATIRDLYRLIRREKPDIVHTTTAKAGFVGRIAARLAGVPYIFHTYHGHVFHSYFSPAKTQFYLALERFGAALSTRVITVSENLKREIGEVYRVARPAKVEIVVPGYDLAALYALKRPLGDFRARFAIPADAPLVGIVGRLVPIKNHALFLEAAQRVHEALPAAKFAIVGDGELRAEVEGQVRALNHTDSVIFTGWQSDLPAIYAALDAVVVSSKNEGLPSAIIEGLVTGVPVVATAVGGVVDLLAEGRGALIPPGDAEGMARGLIAALSDPAIRARAEAGRQAAFDQYHIVPSVERLDAFYRRFVG